MDHVGPLITVAVLCLVPVAAIAFPLWVTRRKNRFYPLVENKLRLPGESLRQAVLDQYTDILGLYFLMFVAIAGAVFLASAFKYSFLGIALAIVLGSILLGFLAYRIYHQFCKIMNYRVGLVGEEYTGQELNLLARDGAYVFHDIPYKYGNIDHVVVGYECIFVVETKAVRKPKSNEGRKEEEVLFDGNKLKFPHFTTAEPLKQAQRHADHLSRMLNADTECLIPVAPLVALPGWTVKTTCQSKATVQVFDPRRGEFLHEKIGERKATAQFLSAVKKIESIARVDKPLAMLTDPDAAEHFNLWTNESKAIAKT